MANAIIDLCEDARDDRPIDRGMLAALKITLNWRGLIDCYGEPVCDLFSEPLRELLDASDHMPRWDEEY
jgi:hypothetical protein